ncbi:type IV toxin-antitoxin system AbiEi family antitoxin [Sanguibacter sp. 25GB23B1]|uniref:type IV toxin-antitoxin system AbiEi family antitoxin n=1 Tax=unclassified Sanguibacter TaxID=2645534 RepID=UPI0032AFACFF
MPSPAPLPRDPSVRLTLDQLLVEPAELQPPYSLESLGARTWETVVRDGDVVELWDGHGLPVGMATTAELRALSIAQHVPHGVVVGRRTAAWVHTGTPRPVRLCVLYAARGYRPRNTVGLEVSQAAVRPWETAEIGGLRVTDPTRTALDVATWVHEDEVLPVLVPLLRHGVELAACLQRLDRVANWRGAGRARAMLLEAARAIRTGSASPPSSSR